MASLSLRALGRELGVSDTAIRKAVRSGRLSKSIAYEGEKPIVADLELAREEWQRNAGGVRTDDDAAGSQPAGGGVVVSAETLNEAQRLATIERARKLRLENDVREGLLVEVSLANREAFEAERIIREAILNIPARISAELASLTDAGAVYLRLDAALRESLIGLAGRLEGGPVQ